MVLPSPSILTQSMLLEEEVDAVGENQIDQRCQYTLN